MRILDLQDSNYIVHNRHFGMIIRGHFARVYVVNNTIFDNFCDEGILAFRGMEKESWIFANNIQVRIFNEKLIFFKAGSRA